MDVIIGGSSASKRRKNDTMGEGESTDLDRSEERREIGGGRHLSEVECELGVEFFGVSEAELLESDISNVWPFYTLNIPRIGDLAIVDVSLSKIMTDHSC